MLEERVELPLLGLQEKAVTQSWAHSTSGTQTPQHKVLEQGERIIRRPAPPGSRKLCHHLNIFVPAQSFTDVHVRATTLSVFCLRAFDLKGHPFHSSTVYVGEQTLSGFLWSFIDAILHNFGLLPFLSLLQL